MSTRTLVALVAGGALVLISLLADTLGLGGEPGFGWKQGIGVGVGAALVLLGLALALRERSTEGGQAAAPPAAPPTPPPPEQEPEQPR